MGIYWSITWLLLFATSTSVTPQPAATQPDQSVALPTEIHTALERNAAALGPTITITWNMERTSPLAPRDYAKAAGMARNDAVFMLNEQQHVTFSWQNDGRYRKSVIVTPRQRKPAGPAPSDVTSSYDGHTFFVHAANPGETHRIERTTIEDYGPRKNGDRIIEIEYFDTVGLELPVRHVDFKQRASPISTILDLFSDDSQLAAVDPINLDGHPVVRLRLLSTYPFEQRFYLDPQLHYAIRRSETFDSDGLMTSSTNCTDFLVLPGRDLWLPHTSEVSEYTARSKQPYVTTTYHVTDVNLDPIPAEDFVLSDSTPGTLFIDHSGKQRQVHVLQKDGTLRLRPRRPPASQPDGEHGL